METVSLNNLSMKIHGLYVYYLKLIGIKLILAFAGNCNRRSTFLKSLNLVNTSEKPCSSQMTPVLLNKAIAALYCYNVTDF